MAVQRRYATGDLGYPAWGMSPSLRPAGDGYGEYGVREPAASLLDEPLSNLDPRLRVQVRAEIHELQARTRTTMLYLTHDQIEAMTLGHRVAVMDRGSIQQVAPPRVLYAAPANVMVAGCIGNPPMNLLPVRVGDGPALRRARGHRPAARRAGRRRRRLDRGAA